jgi:hypothetical protein
MSHFGPCGKVLYESKGAAAEAARKLRRQRGHLHLEPQSCVNGCTGWHLGRPEEGIRDGRR